MGCGGRGADLCCLGVEKIAEKFVFSRVGVRRMFDPHLGHDGRNAAALFNVRLGMLGSESRFHHFHIGGGGVVLWTQSDHGAAPVKDVANQLKCSGAHAAGLIDTKRHIKDRFPAMNGLGNHQLLIFGPGEFR